VPASRRQGVPLHRKRGPSPAGSRPGADAASVAIPGSVPRAHVATPGRSVRDGAAMAITCRIAAKRLLTLATTPPCPRRDAVRSLAWAASAITCRIAAWRLTLTAWTIAPCPRRDAGVREPGPRGRRWAITCRIAAKRPRPPRAHVATPRRRRWDHHLPHRATLWSISSRSKAGSTSTTRKRVGRGHTCLRRVLVFAESKSFIALRIGARRLENRERRLSGFAASRAYHDWMPVKGRRTEASRNPRPPVA
jgi:hypothetical protein